MEPEPEWQRELLSLRHEVTELREELSRLSFEQSSNHSEVQANFNEELAKILNSHDDHKETHRQALEALDDRVQEELSGHKRRHVEHAVALRELDGNIREELASRHGKSDAASRATMQALDTKFSDELTRLTGDSRKLHGSLKDLLAEHKDDMHATQEKKHAANRQALTALDEKFVEEMSIRQNKWEAAHKTSNAATVSRIEEEFSRATGESRKTQGVVKELLAEHKEDMDATSSRRVAEVRQQVAELETRLAEELAGRLKKQDSSQRAQLLASEDALRQDLSSFKSEHQKASLSTRNLVAEIRADLEGVQVKLGQANRALIEALEQRVDETVVRCQKLEISQKSGLTTLETELREEITRSARSFFTTEKKALTEELEANFHMELDSWRSKLEMQQRSASQHAEDALAAEITRLGGDLAEVRDAVLQHRGELEGQASVLRAAADDHKVNIDGLTVQIRQEIAKIISVEDLVFEDESGLRRPATSLQGFLEDVSRRLREMQRNVFVEKAARERSDVRIEQHIADADRKGQALRYEVSVDRKDHADAKDLYAKERALLQEELHRKEAAKVSSIVLQQTVPQMVVQSNPPSPHGSLRVIAPMPGSSLTGSMSAIHGIPGASVRSMTPLRSTDQRSRNGFGSGAMARASSQPVSARRQPEAWSSLSVQRLPSSLVAPCGAGEPVQRLPSACLSSGALPLASSQLANGTGPTPALSRTHSPVGRQVAVLR